VLKILNLKRQNKKLNLSQFLNRKIARRKKLTFAIIGGGMGSTANLIQLLIQTA